MEEIQYIFDKFGFKPLDWEQRFALYCAYLVEVDKLQSSMIKSYISAIKAVLKNDGYNWNDSKVCFSAIVRACELQND